METTIEQLQKDNKLLLAQLDEANKRDQSSYIHPFKYLWIWDMRPQRFITTCQCAPFVQCGCRSIKLSANILPMQGYYRYTWCLVIYLFGPWIEIQRSVMSRTDKVRWRITKGFARKSKVKEANA